MRAALLAIALLFPHFALADTITLAADVWCPYNCEPGSDKPGFAVEIAKDAFEAAGHTVDYKVLPWARAIEEGRAGNVTGIIGAFQEDAPDFIFPAHPVGMSGNIFYVKAGSSWRYDNMKSLDNVSLGVIRDYSYDETLDKYVADHRKDERHIQVVSGDDALQKNIRKLIGERIGATIEDKAVMAYALKQMGKEGKVVEAGSLGEDKAFIAFSPKNPKSQDYAHILSEGIERLQASGKLKEIMARYGM